MYGMDAMSEAVKPLADVPAFTGMLTKFSNPVLGLLAGTILTAVIQSSSASVGIYRRFVNRCSQLCDSDPDHHGTEYRNLYHRNPFCDRCKEKCKACGNRASVF